MATSYTSLLGLALPTTGELQGTWGDTVNNSITSLLDSAVAGTTTLSTDGDVTLSTTTGAANQARQAILLCSGARTAIRTITAPAQSKIYTIINATTGGYAVKLVGVGPTTGVTIPAGYSGTFAWNGSDFVDVSNYVSGNKYINGNLTVTGNLTLSGGTANGVAYLNGSKVVTTGSALTFDGTNLTLGGTAVFAKSTVVNALSGSSAAFAISDNATTTMYANNVSSGVSALWSSGALAFGTNNGTFSEQMRLTSTGLGIGTSSPSYKLQVAGTSGTVGIGLTGTHAANDIGLYISPSAITGGYSAINSVPSATGAVGYTFANSNSANSAAHSRVDVQVGGASAGDPKTTYTISGVLNWSVGVDNSDSDKFKISGSDSPGSSDYLTIDTSGNVGIGTSSPATRLSVDNTRSDTAGTGWFTYTNAAVTSGKRGMRVDTNNVYWFDYYNGSSWSAQMGLDSSGNLGLGVTPSAWGSNFKAIDVGTTAAFYAAPASGVFAAVDGNNYSTSGGAFYKTNGFATRYFQLTTGGHAWYTAASGTAGNAITFTQAMTLTAAGRLGLGLTSPSTLFEAYGGAAGTSSELTVGNASTAARFGVDTSNEVTVATGQAVPIKFLTSNTERARIDSSGNLCIGTSSSAGRVQINGANTTYDTNCFGQVLVRSTTAYNATPRAGIAFSVLYNSAGDYTAGGCTIQSFKENSTNGDFATGLLFTTQAYGVAPSEKMRITSGGAVCIGTTGTFSNAGLVVDIGSGGTNRPIAVHGTGGVDGTYVDWLVSAPYGSNTTEINIIKSSISSVAGNSGLQFWISDGGGASTTTRSFQINRTSCTVVGSLSKGSGSFKIDHPLPEKASTHHLVHSFIEGPQADLIYRGKVNLVNGSATINIDQAAGMTEGTFVVLCRDVQCFTTNESDWTAVRGSVSGNILTIETQDNSSTASISWMVIGERQDKHMYETEWTDENGKVIVEPLKPNNP